jgi:hypothetical protein
MIDVTHNVQTLGAITHALCRVQARATWVEEATANARLIAAAPEMAEAIDRFIPALWLLATGGNADAVAMHDEARAILARINGDAP